MKFQLGDFSARNETALAEAGVLLIKFGVIVALSVSCGCNKMVRRFQSPDNLRNAQEATVSKTTYINDACAIAGLDFAKIEGIGLVGNLSATGSNPPPSPQRNFLLKELQSYPDNENPKSLIASKNTSMVVIKGMLPPGIRKGEKFDIEVRTLASPKTETTSLAHGILLPTRMRTVVPIGRSIKQGHVIGVAKGPVLIDAHFESRQDEPNQLRGWILGGGTALEDRSLGLVVRSDKTSVKLTRAIAQAINARFTTIDHSERDGVATAKSDRLIELVVPDEYQHNIGRYMQVIVNIAFNESDSDRVNRMEQLDRDLDDPALSGTTALRLEALGQEGVPALRRALQNPNPAVKFYVAQALAYMGQADGVEVLKTAAESEPAFRWHALTALASLDDIAAGAALIELMHGTSAETRYGAFRAMLTRSPNDPAIAGKRLANNFYFHVVPSRSQPMLHFSRSKRPEIVVFGGEQSVTDDFIYVETGLTIKAIGGGKVRVLNYPSSGEEIRKVCSTNVADLIQTLAEMGCDYARLVTIFRDAKKYETLNSRLVINAVPRIELASHAAVGQPLSGESEGIEPGVTQETMDAETASEVENPAETGHNSAAPTKKPGILSRMTKKGAGSLFSRRP